MQTSDAATAVVERYFALMRNGDISVVDLFPVSYTHLRAHETVLDLVCRLLLEKKTHHCKFCLY